MPSPPLTAQTHRNNFFFFGGAHPETLNVGGKKKICLANAMALVKANNYFRWLINISVYKQYKLN